MKGNKKDRREGGREGGGRQSERIEGGNVKGDMEDRMEGGREREGERVGGGGKERDRVRG